VTPSVSHVLKRLYDQDDRPTYGGPDDILGTLARTILSQQTTSANASEAFAELLDEFGGDWERIRRAGSDAVAETIEVAGLANQKARRIVGVLEWLDEHRERLSLEFLREKTAEEARDFLTDFKGVGPKTASFTLMDAAGMPLFPMDTHILRICERLGWIEDQSRNEQAHERMLPAIPDGEHYAAHIALVRHGRRRCHSSNPACQACPLSDLCSYDQSRSHDQ